MSTWIVRFGFFLFLFLLSSLVSFCFVSFFVSLQGCKELFKPLLPADFFWAQQHRARLERSKTPQQGRAPPSTPGRPIGGSSRAARGNVRCCWRARPGARGGAPAGLESRRSAQRPRGAGAGSAPAPDGAGGEGGCVAEDLKASVASSVSLRYPMCKCCTSVYYAHKRFFEYDRTDLITSQVQTTLPFLCLGVLACVCACRWVACGPVCLGDV